MWNDLIKVKEMYLEGRKMAVGNGKMCDFWHDAWCGEVSLKEKFPSLFEVCYEQVISVAHMAQKGWRLTFRRWLNEQLQD